MPRGGKRPGTGRKPGGMPRLQAMALGSPVKPHPKRGPWGGPRPNTGGARPGAGRPAGRLNDLTLEALAIAAAENLPLDAAKLVLMRRCQARGDGRDACKLAKALLPKLHQRLRTIHVPAGFVGPLPAEPRLRITGEGPLKTLLEDPAAKAEVANRRAP